MRRVHLFVRGKVQGVWFRATTAEKARSLGLRGLARNLPDGRVEVVAEGSPEALEALVAFCKKGPPKARVDGVDVRYSEAVGDLGEDFVVR